MKKFFLFIMLFAGLSMFLKAQTDVNLGDFEDGSLGPYYSWNGAPLSIEYNPTGNADAVNPSDSVALFDQSGGAWDGFARWNDTPILQHNSEAIELDAYFNTAGTLQLYMDNTVASGAATYTQGASVPEKTWTHVVYDITDLPALDYKQIAYQGSVADSIFLDNIVMVMGEDLSVDTFYVENEVAVEHIRDASDYSVALNMNWDADSIYLFFDVTDDTIFNNGVNSYQVDNIEIYVDMNNSKGSGFDSDDFQFRIMNDSTWENTASSQNLQVGGVRMIYTVVLDGPDTVGYTYDLAVPFDSIGDGVTPYVGAKFGFDVLASDNDGTPFFRDQLSWNSPSGDLWNTPYYWGTLEFAADGKFMIIPDTEAPSAPPNLVVVGIDVEAGEIEIDWDPSEDNTGIAGYIVSINDAPVDTVTGSRYTAEGLSSGSYTFAVVAVDIYGNESDPSTVDASITGTIEIIGNGREISVYPNPAFDVLMIKTTESIEKIEILDISGKTVLTKARTKELNVSDLNRGVYFIKVQTESGTYTSRFLKN